MSPAPQSEPEPSATDHALDVLESIAVSLDRIATVMESGYMRDRKLSNEPLRRKLEEAIVAAAERSLEGIGDVDDYEPTPEPTS